MFGCTTNSNHIEIYMKNVYFLHDLRSTIYHTVIFFKVLELFFYFIMVCSPQVYSIYINIANTRCNCISRKSLLTKWLPWTCLKGKVHPNIYFFPLMLFQTYHVFFCEFQDKILDIIFIFYFFGALHNLLLIACWIINIHWQRIDAFVIVLVESGLDMV